MPPMYIFCFLHGGGESNSNWSSVSSDRYRDDCQDSMISTTTHFTQSISAATTSSSSPTNSSKRCRIRYHAQSIDPHQLTHLHTFIFVTSARSLFYLSACFTHSFIRCYDSLQPEQFAHICLVLLVLVSKENDFESSASSVDTDMEDNSCHGSENRLFPDPSSSTLVPNPVLIPSRPSAVGVHDDLHSVSMTVRDSYLPADLSHIHLLEQNNSIADPNLNHHNSTLIPHPMNTDLPPYHHEQVLQFFPDSSSITPDSSPFVKRSRAMITPNNHPATNFDPNGDISFLCDLVTPPANTRTPIYDHWTGRMVLPQSPPNIPMIDHHSSQHIKQEHQHHHRKAL